MIGSYPIGYTYREENPMDRMSPRLGGPTAGGGIQLESILILPVLSILPYPRSYRIGIYHNPTYPIYHILDKLADHPMDWITNLEE